jgi:nicotinamide-nucleotide amidase
MAVSEAELASLAAEVGWALRRKGWMLATAESCTGGWIAQVATAIAGSSQWFERGFVTYSNAAKQEMLGVREETLRQHGAVSEATVREMAAGALAASRAQVAVAVSGIAGPGGGTAEKPVGTVWIAWAESAGVGVDIVATRYHFFGDRQVIRAQTVQQALKGVLGRVAESH